MRACVHAVSAVSAERAPRRRAHFVSALGRPLRPPTGARLVRSFNHALDTISRHMPERERKARWGRGRRCECARAAGAPRHPAAPNLHASSGSRSRCAPMSTSHTAPCRLAPSGPRSSSSSATGRVWGGGRGGRGVGAQEGGELHGGWRKGRQARGRGAPTLLPTHPDTHSPAPCARPPHALTRLPRPMRAPAPCAHPSSPPRPAAAAPARAHGHPGWRRRGPGCPPTCQEQGRGGGLGALGAREGRGVGAPGGEAGGGLGGGV